MRTMAIGLVMLLSVTSAQAAGDDDRLFWTENCSPLAGAAEALEKLYGERPREHGITAWGNVGMLFVNPETGSWTMAIVSPQGLACRVTGGEGWESVPPKSAPGEAL